MYEFSVSFSNDALVIPSTQVPPFLHGSDLHSKISEICKNEIEYEKVLILPCINERFVPSCEPAVLCGLGDLLVGLGTLSADLLGTHKDTVGVHR